MGSKKKDDFDTALIIISNTVQELGQSIILKKKSKNFELQIKLKIYK
jgi:hypothetical protein